MDAQTKNSSGFSPLSVDNPGEGTSIPDLELQAYQEFQASLKSHNLRFLPYWGMGQSHEFSFPGL